MTPLAQHPLPFSLPPSPSRRRPRNADELLRQSLRRRLLRYILQTHRTRMAQRGLGNPAGGS